MASEISQENLSIEKRQTFVCERTLVDKRMYKISSLHLEKRLSFAILNAPKRHNYAIYEDFGILRIFKFCPIWTVLEVF